ncbi:uncharacterized protein LOC128238979 isoform X2 [Mya arenaria]|uniref:uncharacterized protein LOC128238979 isoform X2 n=1 Tax=Mya arenaria TaxID=6604 RepID=UPI0022E6F345|nr:uncharacterized protein LOC128238979 isoform X2 [Mya arenaria]
MGSKTLVKQNSSFEDPLTVHPWDNLKNSLIEELTDDDLNRLLTLSQSKLGAHYAELLNEESTSKGYKFFHCLEDSLKEDGTVKYLQRLMGSMNFHGDSGNVNYQNLFLLYEKEKKEYDANFSKLSLEIDPAFVGRQSLIDKYLEILQCEDQYKGLVLCGEPGIGKTSLARQICYRLMHTHHWLITVCNQREKDDLGQLMNDLLEVLSKELSSKSNMLFEDLPDLYKKKMLIDSIVKMSSQHTSKHLILLDDMDCQFKENPSGLPDLLSSMFDEISNSKNVKFLITVGRKPLFGNNMLEFEVPGLDLVDAIKLLSKTPHQELTVSSCEKVWKDLNGHPMALKTLRETPNMYQNLEPTVDSISGLLQKCFEMLQPVEYKTLLLRLSVFRTNWFDVQAAARATEGMASPQQTQHLLSFLESRNFIEADKPKSFKGNSNQKEKKLYSLHSIVLRFLYDTCEKKNNMKDELETAKEKFICYFCKNLEHDGKKNYLSPVMANNAIEINKPLIDLFFKLVAEKERGLKDCLGATRKTKVAASSRCEYVMSIAEFACVPQKRLNFAKKQSQIAKDKKQLFEYIYWTTKEAECMLACDQMENAYQEVSSVINDFQIPVGIAMSGKVCPLYTAEGWYRHLEEESFTLTRLYMVAGQTLLKIGSKDKNMQKLTLAHENLKSAQAICENIKHKDKINKHDRAKIKNLIGRVHFELGDVNKALSFHGNALRIVEDDAQFTKDGFHNVEVEYRSNIASCQHQLGLNTKDKNDRRIHFRQAMDMFNECIAMNKQMGRDSLPTQVVLLRHRADIFYHENEYEKAIADGDNVRQLCLSLYVSPNTELTMAYERLAYYKFKLGKWLKDAKGEQEKGKEYLYESLEMYNAMLSEICRGGVPSIEQSDESIFLELAELIKKGEPPVRSGLDSEYKEAMDAIQAGDATRIDDHNVAVFRDVAQWLRNRRLKQPSNMIYRQSKANHIKVMKNLGQNEPEITATKRKYETFELGKFSKLIPESRRYKSDYDTQEKVRQDVDQDLDNSTNESEKGSESDSNDNSKSISTSDGYGALVIQSEKSQNAKDVSTIFISEAPSSSIAKQTKVLVRQYGIEEHIPETFHADMDTNQDGDVVTMGHNSQSRQSRLSQASDTSSGYFSLKRTSSLTESRRHSTISSFGSEASQTDSCFDASDGEDADDNSLLSNSQRRMAFISERPQERLSLSVGDLVVTDTGEEVNEPQPKVHKMENDIDVCKMKLGEG